MDNEYFQDLLLSELPFADWVAVLVWLCLFAVNHRVAARVRAAQARQHVIEVADRTVLLFGSRPRNIVLQLVFSGAVFAFASLMGAWLFPFFAGGLIVGVAGVLALNVQGLLAWRSLEPAGVAQGSVTFSTPLVFRTMAYRLAGGAVAFALAGLVLAHLSLLGGALFMGSASRGYLRRAHRAGARV